MVHHFELRDGIISFFQKLSSTEGRNKGSPEACLIFHSCVKQGLYKFVGMDMGTQQSIPSCYTSLKSTWRVLA